MQLRLEQIALPPCGGRKQNQPVDRQALRGKDRNQPTFAVTDQNHFRESLGHAQMVHHHNRIIDKVLKAEILPPTELRRPSAGTALVVATRRDAANHQLLTERLQRRRREARAVTVMVG